MEPLRLGIIGLSDGNGHPFSWSAIFNGFDAEAMAECGFPGIPAYLARQRFPQDAIPAARVTHVWTQDPALSDSIRRAARVDHVVATPEQMIGAVDAILLARDDAENHARFAMPFIEAGLPIYIDKPMALSRAGAERLFAAEQRTGQVFSCSALRFAREMILTPETRARIGEIRHVSARVPKSWEKYAIHVIDPILENLGPIILEELIFDRMLNADAGLRALAFGWDNGRKSCLIEVSGHLPSPIEVCYHGETGCATTVFADSFAAFKTALEVFLEDSVRGRISHRDTVLQAITILAMGARNVG
jgi:hypothetical protein